MFIISLFPGVALKLSKMQYFCNVLIKYQVLPVVYLGSNWYFDSMVDILIIKHTFYGKCSTLLECIGFHLENDQNELIWMAVNLL